MTADVSAGPVLLVERREIASGRVEIWTLNRPAALNALNADLLKAVDDAGTKLLAELQKNPTAVRALILTGAGGKAFAAGADIVGMQSFDSAQAEAFGRLGQRAFTRIEELPIPTIAAIHGFALGGGLEIAMGCDVLLATPTSEFGQPESYLGLLPGFGATARFAERLGLHKALELLYSGRRIKADEAMSLGLIQRMAPADKPVLDTALALAEELTIKSGPLALAAIKAVARKLRTPETAQIQEAEAKAFGKIFATKDAQEGIKAFVEKRKAKFTGA